MELEFLQPSPRVSLDDEASISVESLFENLSSLQAFVQEKSGGGTAIRDLEIKIRDFALHAEDRIEIQLSNFVLAKDTQDQQKASQQLHQILGEAAENAAELLKIIINQADDDDDDDEANESDGQPLIPWLKNNDTSLRRSSMVGRCRDHTMIKDILLENIPNVNPRLETF
ncbi:PREDICTED: uncharacterized protein LOC109146682 [Ipomoea nil]|uniref:uncharacterized protein LOC109146682 n=1 Tax=Ipomoea nil TaxID=35883 RepID=UPI00090133B6|nr:PREDICTED: uncharacterized protein LOC109146682 [Ipomoea nil]